MITNILTAEQHNARSPRELRERHEHFLRLRKQKRGVDTVPHDVAEPISARVNHGQWVLMCSCGAGVLTHPAWRVGRCFSCGAVYTDVVFPDDVAAVEAALVRRPLMENRNWVPGETAEGLQQESLDNGVAAIKEGD